VSAPAAMSLDPWTTTLPHRARLAFARTAPYPSHVPKDDHDERHDGPAHTSPYGLSRLAPAITLVDTAKEIERADELIGTVAHAKLKTIADQIRALQQQARGVLEEAKRDLELHRASCSFSRRPGHTYHLYEKADGALYWSMLSPADWGDEPPHRFTGTYRLEADQSWTPAGEIPEHDADPDLIRHDVMVKHLLKAE